ncbi:MAG: WYL domain-containing protein [Thermoanaerobaculia bacterium]|nr:WYL domain-containing protein [Thermoanaerobaculia bacterium]
MTIHFVPLKDRPLFRRMLELDEMLRRDETVTSRALSRRWEISPKTALRLIEQLRVEYEAPIEFDQRRQTFFYADKSFRPPWLSMGGKDLFAIGVAQKVLQLYEGTPVYEELAEIYQRLAEFMPKELHVRPTSLMERLFIHPQPLRLVDREVWGQVTQSLLDRTVARINYQKPGQAGVWREIEPYSLVLAASDWLVVARDPSDELVKSFYLGRIRKAEGTAKIYVIPKDFDLRSYLGDSIGIYSGGKTFRFRVRFSTEVAPAIREVRWHPKQTLHSLPGGEVELELPAGHPLEAKRFVLGFGKHAEVVSPVSLVEELARETEEMAARYRKTLASMRADGPA